jgi:hypothetical protein
MTKKKQEDEKFKGLKKVSDFFRHLGKVFTALGTIFAAVIGGLKIFH